MDYLFIASLSITDFSLNPRRGFTPRFHNSTTNVDHAGIRFYESSRLHSRLQESRERRDQWSWGTFGAHDCWVRDENHVEILSVICECIVNFSGKSFRSVPPRYIVTGILLRVPERSWPRCQISRGVATFSIISVRRIRSLTPDFSLPFGSSSSAKYSLMLRPTTRFFIGTSRTG